MIYNDPESLRAWIETLDEATRILSQSGTRADFSRESLAKIWNWLKPQCALSSTYGSGKAEDPLDTNPEMLPAWAKRPGHHRERITLSVHTLELVGYMARYFGECLHREISESEWCIWTWNEPKHAVMNEKEFALALPLPVHRQKYDTHTSPIFPVSDVLVLVQRLLHKSSEPSDLTSSYDLRLRTLQEGVEYITKDAV